MSHCWLPLSVFSPLSLCLCLGPEPPSPPGPSTPSPSLPFNPIDHACRNLTHPLIPVQIAPVPLPELHLLIYRGQSGPVCLQAGLTLQRSARTKCVRGDNRKSHPVHKHRTPCTAALIDSDICAYETQSARSLGKTAQKLCTKLSFIHFPPAVSQSCRCLWGAQAIDWP